MVAKSDKTINKKKIKKEKNTKQIKDALQKISDNGKILIKFDIGWFVGSDDYQGF